MPRAFNIKNIGVRLMAEAYQEGRWNQLVKIPRQFSDAWFEKHKGYEMAMHPKWHSNATIEEFVRVGYGKKTVIQSQGIWEFELTDKGREALSQN